ncbi:hypothetical protein BJ684DRAFT_19409 [Piptocephalis cylindrospora]|uniref:S-adenosyl-L-methionine dependent methyltransferase n=1 Tax=Piptocephalis cylindrospora TaxID=1907219 RepID=A0A4P9Y602_9FUNG|nr:hypothetical protein BJ684DRAFT_19409 [Piptocephalis cylindrospora]|eukprot:RKP14174.1 hypothetical protein BJ684DRAFT_19409 [Piptocephalis cylindrospora]
MASMDPLVVHIKALSDRYPALGPFVVRRQDGSYTLNYTDPEANRLLAEVTLKEYYHLSVHIPKASLCPKGLDIGTGATCIYPLMACRRNPNLSFLATDISEESLECARANVNANDLQGQIRLVRTSPLSTLPVEMIKDEAIRYDFCMCNPPFYSSWEDLILAQETKLGQPAAPITGRDHELITVGGERAFVHRMICESRRLAGKVRWFTTMVGKRETMVDMILTFKEHGVDSFTLGDIGMGRTHRWVIAWSFSEDRPITSQNRTFASNQAIHLLGLYP